MCALFGFNVITVNPRLHAGNDIFLTCIQRPFYVDFHYLPVVVLSFGKAVPIINESSVRETSEHLHLNY
jgi:hypothetical protein